MPLDEHGYVIDEEFLRDVAEQREVEEKVRRQKATSSIIEYPTQYDVLLGRGKPLQDFPGNIRLNILVEQQRSVYDTLNKGGKSACIVTIVETIRQMGGRFLKKCSSTTTTTATASTMIDNNNNNNQNDTTTMPFSYWEEVDTAAAHKKVNNCFQTRKRIQSSNQFGW